MDVFRCAAKGSPDQTRGRVELAGYSLGPAPFQENEKSAAGTQPDCRLNQRITHRLSLLFVALLH
jgi:hypothetical protein